MDKFESEAFPEFSDREYLMICKMRNAYGYDRYRLKKWRSLLDQWHWWAANWRKYPGYFLGKVGVLSFDVFLAHQNIAERGWPIYEKMAKRRRNFLSMDALEHN